MSDAPERVWANTGLYWDYRQDWTEGSWNLDGSGIEYIRADRIEQLEIENERLRNALREIAGLQVMCASDMAIQALRGKGDGN